MGNGARVTIIGSIAFDDVQTAHGKVKGVLGGSCSYSSLSASFFSPVNIVSVIGRDFPQKYITMFKRRGIDVTGLERKDGKTFRWGARYSSDLSYAKTLRTDLNVFEGFRPKLPPNVSAQDNLLLANIDPELQDYIFRQVKPRGIVGCDTMNHWILNQRKPLLKLLKNVDLFLLNDEEAVILSGEKNLMNAAKYIVSKGPKMVIIKKGEHGALFFSKSKHLSFIVPAYLLEVVVDPTGAGDTFAGGVMGYLSRKKKITDTDLRRALVYGSILASFTVEEFSVEGLLKINRKKIEARYRKFKSLTRF